MKKTVKWFAFEIISILIILGKIILHLLDIIEMLKNKKKEKK